MARKSRRPTVPFSEDTLTQRRRQLEVSSQERDAIAARQADTEKLANSLQSHLGKNHFANRLALSFGIRGLK